MFKIAQINDTHEGITKTKHIKVMLQKLAEEDFDVLVHCGDYCGGMTGHKTLRTTVQLIRSIFPDKPFASAIGNHDMWSLGYRDCQPSPDIFWDNYKQILEVFAENNVWFLDEQGPYRQNGCTLVGHSGWYANREIIDHSNDFNFLPIGMDGDTQSFLQKRAMDGLWRNMDLLNEEDQKNTLVFVSHFPVIKVDPEDTGFDLWSWSAALGDNLQTQYGIKTFLNGHAHQHHQGPLRWETGTDYNKPKYQIIEVA